MNFKNRLLYTSKYALSIIISFVLLGSQVVLAQTPGVLPQAGMPNAAQPLASTQGAVSCFDYYTFGSVQVDVAPYFSEIFTNQEVLFGGAVKNNNPYPIVDGQVWMKIFKLEQEDDSLLKENGYPLVDFVLLEENITMAANSQRQVDYVWDAPQYAAEGEYKAAFFFTTAYRYNLLGLTFTDDVVGNTTNFELKSTQPFTPVVFDKNSVRLNDTRTSFALPPRQFEGTSQVMAYATLVNNSEQNRLVELTWTAYKWDALQEDFKLDTMVQNVLVPASDILEVAYQTPIHNTAVTFVEAVVVDGDSKSMLNIRYVRDNVLETRINFPSTFTYPLVAGEKAEVFSCVHSTTALTAQNNTLNLTLQDVNGNMIHNYTYEGDITGAMMGLADSFVPEEDYGSFTLTASLSREGNVVEVITTSYDCNDIDPSLCTAADEKKNVDQVLGIDLQETEEIPIAYYIAALVAVLVLVVSTIVITNRRTQAEEDDILDADSDIDGVHMPDNK